MSKSFNMNTIVTVPNKDLARQLQAKLRAQHHKELLDIIIDADVPGESPVTCQMVIDAFDSIAEDKLNEEQMRIYKKYSAAAHMKYLLNRCRNVVKATADGEELVLTTTAGTAPKAETPDEPAAETPAEPALAAAETA